MSRSVLLATLGLGAASVSAQTVNTQIDGLVLTNGLSTITDTSALKPNTLATAISYLTDNDVTNVVWDVGFGGGTFQAEFGGPISASATGIYIVGQAVRLDQTILSSGSFDIRLVLVSSALTSSLPFSDANYTLTTQRIFHTGAVNVWNDTLEPSENFANFARFDYAYLYIPFASFGVAASDVAGIQMANMTSMYPDIYFIGAGYAASPVVPEASTYGLAIGGLALAVVAVRRQSKISK